MTARELLALIAELLPFARIYLHRADTYGGWDLTESSERERERIVALIDRAEKAVVSDAVG